MTALDEFPLVSVIMPVRNEAATIRRSLGAVLAQDYPPERLEVLIADGMSSDGTPEIVAALAGDDARVRLLRNPARRQAHGLNLAIAAARGSVIARVDGHTVIAPDYIRRCVTTLHATGADNVGGPLRSVGLTPWGRAIAAALGSPFGVPSGFRVRARSGDVDTLHPGAWPRDVFTRVGLFDETRLSNEDYEHNFRIRQAGGRVYLALDIHADYYGRQTLPGLWRQFFGYGRGKLAMLVQYPTSVHPRHVVAPAFVAALTGGALLAPWNRRAARGWRALLIAYGVVSAAASWRAASRAGWALLPRLPVAFACMHLAWGSGFWVEALRLTAQRARSRR